MFIVELYKKYIFPMYAKHNVTHIFANELSNNDMYLQPKALSSLQLKGEKSVNELSARNLFYNFLYKNKIVYLHQLVVRKISSAKTHLI